MQTQKMILGTCALLAAGVAGFATGTTTSHATRIAEPTEQHHWLATHAGNYTAKVSGMMGESDATCKVKSAHGGLWNISYFDGVMMGEPFTGMEIMGYDPEQEKYVSVWVDSMTPKMTTTEGTYDAATKTLTMRGMSVGMDGEEAEMVNTTVYSDDGMTFTMHIEDQPLMTIAYTRKN